MNELLTISNLGKCFSGLNSNKPHKPFEASANDAWWVFRHLNAAILPQQFIMLTGASGAGKSSLLHLIGLLDNPSEGEIYWRGQVIRSTKRIEEWRKQSLGFVYQTHHLLPELTAWENIALPLFLQGIGTTVAKQQAFAMLTQLGLYERRAHLPSELSGGEKQRISIGRALIHRPTLVIADEPTGNLDASNALALIQLLRDLCNQSGQSILMATHNLELTPYAHAVWHLRNGQLNTNNAPATPPL